jgi:predicted permease
VALPLQLRYAVRLLVKNPGFSLAAILVLALGIGANTAIFTVVRAVLLAPLPYKDPDRLVRLFESRVVADNPYNVVSPENYRDWLAQASSYEQMAAVGGIGFALSSASGQLPELLTAQMVSANLFDTLGVRPARGRVFTPEEDSLEAPRLTILSDALWRRRFASDPNVIGANIRLDGENYSVIGIMPPGFDYPGPGIQLWVSMWRHEPKGSQHSRGNHHLSIVGRLKPGVTVSQANTELDGIARRIHQAALAKGELTGKGAAVSPLAERTVARVKPMLVMLVGAVACVLLIACVNVTNLLLTRALARRREVAIRAAIGATRGQLLRQFLTESLLLAGIGAALGIWLAIWATDALVRRAGDIPRIEEAGINSDVFWFTVSVALLTGIVVGLAPALASSRVDLTSTMQEGGRASTPGKRTGLFRDTLVAVEVALSLMLLIGCGLLLKSFLKLRSVDAGYTADRVLTMGISLPSSRYSTNPQRVAFFETMLERTRSIPGVLAAGMVTIPPLAGHWSDESITIEGRPPLPPGQFQQALNRTADPDYFRVLGIPLKQGRFFTSADRLDAPPVMIISEAFARAYFPGEDPLGKRVILGGPREIVGVVGDVRKQLQLDPEPTMYSPLFRGSASNTTLVVRTAGDPASLAIPIQKELGRLDSDLPAISVRTMDQIAEGGTGQRRFGLTLLTLFAGLAVVLAAIGLYGVLSYSIEQRTAELGIRLALGASTGQIARMVLWQGMKPAALGIVAGLAGGAAATQLLETLLYGVKPADPQVLAGVVALIVLVSAAACLVPAWRSTRIDPVVALRS